jgi:hypothetical protein
MRGRPFNYTNRKYWRGPRRGNLEEQMGALLIFHGEIYVYTFAGITSSRPD